MPPMRAMASEALFCLELRGRYVNRLMPAASASASVAGMESGRVSRLAARAGLPNTRADGKVLCLA